MVCLEIGASLKMATVVFWSPFEELPYRASNKKQHTQKGETYLTRKPEKTENQKMDSP